MQAINLPDFTALLKVARVKPRLRREVRFAPEDIGNWEELEFIAVTDRTNDRGVLIIELNAQLYVTPYEINRRIADHTTGRTKPIICDFCFTWQRGSGAGRIRFTRLSDMHDITLICCGDLGCSSHVRSKTTASQLSCANLREDLDNEQRVARLKKKLGKLVELLDLKPVIIDRDI
jgi:hypothetical protein